jgi:hypothetical protein
MLVEDPLRKGVERRDGGHVDLPQRRLCGAENNVLETPGQPGPDETILLVSALHQPVVGLHVATSGSFSGTRTAIRVVQTGLVINVSGFGYIYDQVMAEQASRITAVGNGDSGGPVFRYAPDNRVEAAGIITAMDVGNTEVACTGVPTGPTRKCAWRMFYTDFTSSLWTTGTALVVVR